MFSRLSATHIYGTAPKTEGEPEISAKTKSNSLPLKAGRKAKHTKHNRSTSSLSDSSKPDSRQSRFFASLSSMHGMKTPASFIEKFIKTELLSGGYDPAKSFKNFQTAANNSSGTPTSPNSPTTTTTSATRNPTQPIYSNLLQSDGLLNGLNCLQGSVPHDHDHGDADADADFYEAVNGGNATCTETAAVIDTNDMTIRCAKSLQINGSTPAKTTAGATLENYQKLPDYELGMQSTSEASAGSSGASSGEFNVDVGFRSKPGGSPREGASIRLTNENNSDRSISSLSTTTTTAVTITTSRSPNSSDMPGSSTGSGSSSSCDGTDHDAATQKECVGAANSTQERMQRRKLLQLISHYEQQNKLLQRELAKEKRRRTEELASVVKSLFCFESKLKIDMKAVNRRLMDKDTEICRLVGQNRALRKRLASEAQIQDEGVVGDETDAEVPNDCLVPEALQCTNCRRQFYDIEVSESCTQTLINKDSCRANEHGSSSDDTVSSSFYGARRSVRYTSKRTAGTFRDYMRSRSMNIDDPELEQNSEENTSTVSREDSQNSYEPLHNYSRAIERMHGVKATAPESEHDQQQRSESRLSNKSSTSRSSKSSSEKAMALPPSMQIEEDDGIFSPTQDDDYFDEEDLNASGVLKIVHRRATEFSEASPKQIYETSTDDWYASASDQEEMIKSYSYSAVNPVLECVNQILLQESMEESPIEASTPIVSEQPKIVLMSAADKSNNLPRRSSLSGRRSSMQRNGSIDTPTSTNARTSGLPRKRVHFSTRNSMVHVPRNDDEDQQAIADSEMISHYHPMSPPAPNPMAYEYEYEPIGSERTSSNLYVDMESTAKSAISQELRLYNKYPPALPPKPANLLKFKKSLQQLDEVPDEHLPDSCAASTTTATEPDYCSIAEVNLNSVQTVADIHKAPPSETPTQSELDLEVSTVASDDTFATSQKTEEIEEIFADIPKLPNVAAIIAPKQSKLRPEQPQTPQQRPKMPQCEYLLASTSVQELLDTAHLRLDLSRSTTVSAVSSQVQFKPTQRIPQILADINKRHNMSNTTPTALKPTPVKPKTSQLQKLESCSPALPLQAEFDWYNLDAEYLTSSDQLKLNESPNIGTLAEIQEVSECATANADEYNLDEEFSLATEQEQEVTQLRLSHAASEKPAVTTAPILKAKKIKKNLASFEKFIEGSGLSLKPLPNKRKAYFPAPFV